MISTKGDERAVPVPLASAITQSGTDDEPSSSLAARSAAVTFSSCAIIAGLLPQRPTEPSTQENTGKVVS